MALGSQRDANKARRTLPGPAHSGEKVPPTWRSRPCRLQDRLPRSGSTAPPAPPSLPRGRRGLARCTCPPSAPGSLLRRRGPEWGPAARPAQPRSRPPAPASPPVRRGRSYLPCEPPRLSCHMAMLCRRGVPQTLSPADLRAGHPHGGRAQPGTTAGASRAAAASAHRKGPVLTAAGGAGMDPSVVLRGEGREHQGAGVPRSKRGAGDLLPSWPEGRRRPALPEVGWAGE